MEAYVRSSTGERVGTVELDERVFGIEPNRAVLHQAVVAQQANQRHGTANTLTRGLVAGSGKKPWRQKGTGRARQGMQSAPHWRGGGIVFGPHPRSYHQRLPRKMRRLALRSALSEKMRSEALTVVNRLEPADGRTKELAKIFQALGVGGSVVIVTAEHEPELRQASGNLPGVRVALPNGLSVLEVLRADAVVMYRDAIAPVTRLLLGEADESAVA
ncbi:MAG TPA: 50S ribosomal protein L4 [Chloroflexota bacterium]|nr:50S ribosomal protein L4 [Chloroflexota bacterium]